MTTPTPQPPPSNATATPTATASTTASPAPSATATTIQPAAPRPLAPFARPQRPGTLRRLAARLRTAARLVLHFLHPARFILAPLLIVLLLAGILLSLTGGLAYVAPFVYTLF